MPENAKPKKEYNYIKKTARFNGKRYAAYGKTELEAITKLAEKLAAAKRGEEEIGGNMTVDAWFKQWFELYKEPMGLTVGTLKMYEKSYNNYIRPAIGKMKMRDVKDVHLQRILNGQAGRSKSLVSKIRLTMKAMFQRARQSRIIAYDPAETLVMPDCTEGTRRSITQAERAAILAVAEEHRGGLFVLTLLYTGMRPDEARALTWANVDFDSNEIHVQTAAETRTGEIKAPKTPAGIRDIPIHAALRTKLLAARGAPFDRVFLNTKGQPLHEKPAWWLWRSFVDAMEKYTGEPVSADLTLYCLRHTFCTDLQRAGVPLNVAKELMGHADISMTANIYTHTDAETLHNGIALLDGTGSKSRDKKISDMA